MIFKKNKRGMVLIFVLGLLFCFLIMPMLFIKLETKKFQFERKLGDIQYDSIDTYQTADKILFYIDESARYATNQAIFDLGLNGGHTTGCQEYKGYPLWVTEEGDCYPEPKKNILIFIENYLNEYFIAYPNDILIEQLNNYDFLVEQKAKLIVTGIAAVNLEIPVMERREREKKEEELYEEKYGACIFGGVYDEQKAQEIIDVAREYKEDYSHLPYVWGGFSIEKGGFDCSGLVYRVFQDAEICGFDARLESYIYERYGKTILVREYDAAELKPSDVLYIDYTQDGKVDHMAIYVGDDKILHSSRRGKGINEENVPQTYKDRIYSIKRYALKPEGELT